MKFPPASVLTSRHGVGAHAALVHGSAQVGAVVAAVAQ